MPVPLSVEVCVPLSSTTDRTADSADAVEGVKVTLTLQVAPAASVAPQVVVLAKSAALVPPSVIEATSRRWVSAVLSSTIAKAGEAVPLRWLPYEWLEGLTVAFGKMPVPLRAEV